MSAQKIYINQVNNTGTEEIQLNFTPAEGSTISVSIPPQESFSLIPILIGMPQTPLRFDLQALGKSSVIRNCELYYEEVGGMNSFSLHVYYGGVSKTTPIQQSPTTIGSNIFLDLAYSGDGVVIVGTGDI